MNEKTNKALEYVSALMDGEALTDEMLDAVLADEEALRAWHEYHIIGDCIRQGAAASVTGETMQSKAFTVPQAEAEGKQEKYAQREAANSGFFKFFAAAASVCAIAVAVWQFTPQTSRESMPVAEKSNVQPAQNIIPVNGTPVEKQLPNLARLLCRMRQKTANLKIIRLSVPSSKMINRLLYSKK